MGFEDFAELVDAGAIDHSSRAVSSMVCSWVGVSLIPARALARRTQSRYWSSQADGAVGTGCAVADTQHTAVSVAVSTGKSACASFFRVAPMGDIERAKESFIGLLRVKTDAPARVNLWNSST